MSVRERFNISRLAIAHPWLTVAFWIAVTVGGVFAFRTLQYSLLPDITFPVVIVNIQAPLSSASETSGKIARPVEQRLKSLEGLDEIRASVYPGRVVVTLSFRVGLKLDRCARDTGIALRDVKLPAGVEPKIVPLNLNQTSAAGYALSGDGKSLAELAKIAREKIIPAIEKTPGVLEVSLLGEPMTASDPQASQAALQAPSIVRLNGQPVLALEVIKRSDANTLDVVEHVKSEVARLHAVSRGVRLILARTQADYIREATHSTVESLLIAVALSVLVIFPFLWSWPATIISALAIPTSLLGTAIVMALCGFELDTITLLALALVIGIIIDDAIVDVENIARHLEEGGESPRLAALSATREIGLTVAAATFTIVAVFLPVGLMQGSVGQFFKPFGVTVSAAVVISLLVARTLSPLLAVYWLKPVPAHGMGPVWRAIVAFYRLALHWSLHHRKTVVGIAVASFVGGLALIPLIPKGLIPRLDRGEFKVVYHADSAAAARGGNPFAGSLAAAKSLEDFVRAFPDVREVYTIIGSREGDPGKGVLHVRLSSDKKIHTAEIEDRLRRSLPKLQGVTTSVEDVPFVELGDQKPIDVAIVGDDHAAIERASSSLADRLRKTHGFVDVTSSSRPEDGENHIEHLGTHEASYLSANLVGGYSLGEATERVVSLSHEIFPPGVSLHLDGDSANIATVFGSFGITLGLAVVCIIAVLLLLFRNWVDPLVIVLALPLAVVGAVFALLVVRSEFGMISLIGVVFLFGLVNKNAILLVDYVNQLRASGHGCIESILRAGPVRLRPILMTTLATILGMMPVAIGLGVGSELRAPMAVAIIGGLITSTLLSLIVVPVVYAMLDPLRKRRSKA